VAKLAEATAKGNEAEIAIATSALENTDRNSKHYFDIEKELDILAKLKATGLDLALQGEICGPKINGGKLKIPKNVFRAYKVRGRGNTR
jgi:hypothetical protein